MACEGIRNASANWDLKKAREAYETQTTQKEKRKIEELEVAVTEEEEQLDVQALETEMDWLSDLCTTTTRATQFVRTQGEMWRMKTMLAKALNMHAEDIKRSHQAISLISAENSAKLDAMEFNVSALTQEVRILSQKLGVLINLLRLSIHQGTNVAVEVSAEVTDTSKVKRPTPERIPQLKFETATAGLSAPSKDYVILKL